MKTKLLHIILAGLWSAGGLMAATIYINPGTNTIQPAITSAANGDTIILNPGTYTVSSKVVVNKKITIGSAFITSGNLADRDAVVVTPSFSGDVYFEVKAGGTNSPGNFAVVKGLSFNASSTSYHSVNVLDDDWAEISYCKIRGGKDQLSLTNAGGRLANNDISGAGDDNIDCDDTKSWIIENNLLNNPNQDGIEVRLHNNTAAARTHYFRRNTVIGAGESGIQLIDYSGQSNRTFYIYGNIFKNCDGAGVSMMNNELTDENYAGSVMVESAFVYNNTFDGCNHGMTMAPYVRVLNNIFTNSLTRAITRGSNVPSGSANIIVDYCNFYNNAANIDSGLNTGANNRFVNPQYVDTINYQLASGSPMIDAGVASYTWNGVNVLNIPTTDYSGSAPDLGAKEFGSGGPPTNQAPIVDAGPASQVLLVPATSLSLDGTVQDDGLPTGATVTSTWSKVSGPGTVTFGNAAAIDTTVSFSQQGTYVLKLSASDTALVGSDNTTVTYAKAFNDVTVNAISSNVFFEAENYRYLVNGVSVVSAATASGGQAINATSVSLPAYSEYLVQTADKTHYVWVRVTGPNTSANKVYVALNDLSVETLLTGTSDGVFSNASWVRATIATPAGSYPLRIRAAAAGVSWDRIFFTDDPNANPTTATTVTFTKRINSSGYDAEERPDGTLSLTSTDLELVYDAGIQVVGLRFVDVLVPQGATIVSANIQFTADESASSSVTVNIQADDADSSAVFSTSGTFNLSGRSFTSAMVPWAIPAWTAGQTTSAQKTPDIKAVVQEVISRPGWVSGNRLSIIITGVSTSKRTAAAYDGSSSTAALLTIQYQQ